MQTDINMGILYAKQHQPDKMQVKKYSGLGFPSFFEGNQQLCSIEAIFHWRHSKAMIAGRNGFSVCGLQRRRSYDEVFVNYCLLKCIAVVFIFLLT